MTPDIDKVAAACMRAAMPDADDWERQPETAREMWRGSARAAMVATREIDAEGLRMIPVHTHDAGLAVKEAADWLQQRANDVKEMGRG